MRAAVAMPVAMNFRVATIERAERRLTPQTPGPLVQPLPRRVPTPTASPATTGVAGLAKLASIPPDTNITTSAPRGRQITNIQAPLRHMPLTTRSTAFAESPDTPARSKERRGGKESVKTVG